MFFVIMAGGQGTRLWPKSRSDKPKQFQSLDGTRSFLQLAVERVLDLGGYENTFIVTGRRYVPIVRDQLPELPDRNIIVEPTAKNTAPCMGLAAVTLAHYFGSDDAVMAVLPSDHVIKKRETFQKTLQLAGEVAAWGPHVVTLGIEPSRPETGYGYIRYGGSPLSDSSGQVYKVERFVEKPDLNTAKAYLADGQYLWNSGIFIWKISTFMDLVERHMPELYHSLLRIKEALGTPNEDTVVRDEFERLEAVSVDYGIMEKAESVYVIPCDIGWDDVGTWSALERLLDPDENGNILQGKVLVLDTKRSIVHGGRRLIATLGLDNMLVVDTSDALLVAEKSRAQDVKRIIEELRKHNPRYLSTPKPANRIEFGPDGWRGVIGDTFTFENVSVIAQAIAEYIHQRGEAERGLVVGYDRRFQSDAFARQMAKVLTANGVKVYLTKTPATTPSVSFSVKHFGAAGGVMITAGHNPPEWNGVKFKGPYGGSASPEITREIEAYCHRIIESDIDPEQIDLESAEEKALLCRFDPKPVYLRHLMSLVSIPASFEGLKVVVDPMHGSGAGFLDTALAQLGCEVIQIRSEFNPGFGGVNPEPIEDNLEALREAVLYHKADLGLALDGDADRIGAMDHTGRVVHSYQIFALLLEHLVQRRGWRGGVVKTFSTSKMIDRLVQKYGLKLYETPIGFKYICDWMLKEDILIGGDESGGIGIKHHIPESDGVLCGMLLTEIVGMTGQSLYDLTEIQQRTLGPHYYNRYDLHLSPQGKEAVVAVLKGSTNTPEAAAAIESMQARRVEHFDGYKFYFDEGWLLIRPSGDEPLLRLYAEGTSPEAVESYLDCCMKLIEAISATLD